MAIVLTTHASAPDTLIKDVGVIIPGSGGSDSFSDPKDLVVIARSQDIITFGTDDEYGPGEHTLIVSDDARPIDPADLATYLPAVSAPAAGVVAPAVVDAVLATEGPGAGIAPLQWTFADGTIKDYTYKPDGLTVDTVTVTRPGQSSQAYSVQYTAEGVPYKMTPIP